MKKIRFILIGAVVIVIIAASVFILSRLKTSIANGQKTIAEESLIKEAGTQAAQGKLSAARDLYQRAIRDYPQGKSVSDAQKATWDLNIKLLFSQTQAPDSKIYQVEPGDTLGKIAKKFNTTVELLMRSNNLKSDLIRPGMRLKVCTAKFSILVDKSQNTLTLKANDDIFKIYTVATGLDNSTPIGTFTIVTKEVNPTWYKSGAIVPPGSPKNILGTRWMGISLPGYGIHGTTEPESIGKQVTAGCVRMLNNEVEELYTIVPSGTEVTIVD
ncbi:MAG: L,D-transpeptidase family protein [Candidatus Omnitrophica bacterium]|nr:L,D-transpeptidase family protein [Candidatus Omnitrophota bacterium]